MKITEFTKHIFKLAVLTGILFLLSGCKNSMVKMSQVEIDTIAKRFVPDKRIAICRIKAKSTNFDTLILTGETTSLMAKEAIIKALNSHRINLIDSILILPDSAKNEKFLALASLSVINLRKDTDHAAELVSQCKLGTPLRVLKEDDYWLLVQTPDNYIAWTERTSVAMMDRSAMNEWKKSDRIIYIENSGWIYSSPGSHEIIGDLVAGDIVEKTGESNGFTNVRLPDGRTGFVNKKEFIEFNDFRNQNTPEGSSIIKQAASVMGVPYLWGGASSKGFDCSGFVQTVFFLNGIILQRDASLQALHGDPVDLSGGFSKLETGDLLFFGSRDKSGQHVSHVAIYMGDNKYINSSGRVMINSLDSADSNFSRYRLYTLLSARRIISVNNDKGIVTVRDHPWY
jgi:gamma-D-glutamyl-L-lysine dipeptidyl-peptidase